MRMERRALFIASLLSLAGCGPSNSEPPDAAVPDAGPSCPQAAFVSTLIGNSYRQTGATDPSASTRNCTFYTATVRLRELNEEACTLSGTLSIAGTGTDGVTHGGYGPFSCSLADSEPGGLYCRTVTDVPVGGEGVGFTLSIGGGEIGLTMRTVENSCIAVGERIEDE